MMKERRKNACQTVARAVEVDGSTTSQPEPSTGNPGRIDQCYRVVSKYQNHGRLSGK